MGHTWKINGSHLENWVTLGKLGYPCKKKGRLEKWVTLEKLGHI